MKKYQKLAPGSTFLVTNFQYLVPSSQLIATERHVISTEGQTNMAEQPSFPGFERSSREQRIAEMDEEILDVTRAARALGVSSKTVYSMARQGKIPATRVGREWRFSRKMLIDWVAKSSENDQLVTVLRNGKIRGRRG
jgi:excisionase family DNA binding protein